MNDTTAATTADPEFADFDVFAAARWLGGLHNSTAKAVSLTEIEWQCTTWGSGRGRGDHYDIGLFTIVCTVFDLEQWRNRDGRDELVVGIPLSTFPRAAALIDRLGDDPEGWPWFAEEAEDRELEAAAEVLDIPTDLLAADPHLRRALGLG